jgi:hypothetical protein
VAETELGLNLRPENTNKVGLAEARVQGHEETENHQASVGDKKLPIGGDGTFHGSAEFQRQSLAIAWMGQGLRPPACNRNFLGADDITGINYR